MRSKENFWSIALRRIFAELFNNFVFVFNVTYFRESLTDWVIGINLEDAVQVILLQHRDARISLRGLDGPWAGGGRGGGVRGGGLVSQLPRARDARTGKTYARPARGLELNIHIY